MSQDSPLHSGWHTTDDEVVPVKQAQKKPAAPVDNLRAAGTEPQLIVLSGEPHVKSSHLAAVTGVLTVTIAAGMYFGFSNLLGSVDSVSEKTVTITTDGNFDPAEIVLHAGEKLKISNLNEDPQVLKSRGDKDLFPVQVIFQEPFVFTVPADAAGIFVYGSETLPDDKILTITVTSETTATASGSSTSAEITAFDIPLPFGAPPVISSSASSSSISSSSSSSSSQADSNPGQVLQTDNTVTISLQGSSGSSSSSAPVKNNLPTNPYTVGSSVAKNPQAGAQVSRVLNRVENLRSGAPIRDLRAHTPKTVTATGPEGTLLLLFPALAGVMLMFRKLRIEN
ncbi:hypothetical protein A3A67_03445 [Candidatus Peribacteria bacterium RIFCSPLOWO2_01_FULL_51_18]|nr:MAG: hypothetical protein A3C52_04695 [Candidatus Peribacteria bacterium RIFCSPHIGHO2_02_FULL_51_15]OGJ65783.1 MAG: hypothetical protein A3A67_03445 [Candidatus Peribacteria bacterium RIFCSPLOWO2_01_FULL_51_18]